MARFQAPKFRVRILTISFILTFLLTGKRAGIPAINAEDLTFLVACILILQAAAARSEAVCHTISALPGLLAAVVCRMQVCIPCAGVFSLITLCWRILFHHMHNFSLHANANTFTGASCNHRRSLVMSCGIS